MTTNKMSTDMDRVGQAVAVGAAVRGRAVPDDDVENLEEAVAVPVPYDEFEVVDEDDVPYRSLAASMHCIKLLMGMLRLCFDV